MENKYAAPQLFSLLESNYIPMAVGTCRANRKLFESKKLLLDLKYYRGTFKRLVDKHLGMVIKILRDSNILQIVSTKITKCIGQINRKKGRD